MHIASRLSLLLLAVLLSAPHIAAQQVDSGAHPGERIYLDAVVSSASGPPISNLQQHDFTIFDNDIPQTITSFAAIDARQAQIAIIIVLDTLSLKSLDTLSLKSRALGTTITDIKRFLKSDGGELTYPTTVDFITAKGLEFRAGPSRNGKAMSALVDKPAKATATEEITGDPGSYPPFQALAELVALEREKPGRKIILFVSPGWFPTLKPESRGKPTPTKVKLQQLRLGMFGNIVQLTRQLHEGRITVYSIDPPVVSDLDDGFTNGVTHLRSTQDGADVAGVRSPSDVHWDDLAMRAVAVRSGGLALPSGPDLTSSLRQCVDDISPLYELSFDPVLTDEPNLYHRLKVDIAKPGLIARTRQGYYSQPWPGTRLTEEKKLGEPDTTQLQDGTADQDVPDTAAQNSDSPVSTYIDLPLDQLIQRVPDLKGLRPAEGQKQLPMILERTGASVDSFIKNVGDLIANEDVTQQRLTVEGKIKAKERVQDDYLILHHGYEWGANAEYRMDKNGKRLRAIGLDKGFLVTSGYALSSMSFSTNAQSQSNFLYLGDQKLGARDAFVVAYAQRPGEVTFTSVMRGTGGHEVDLLTQGILWIDKSNFQILRTRSDLLTPNPELRLNQLTTDVTFSQVQLKDNPALLWLPEDVAVYIEIANERYRNQHRYTNYRRYQVAVKIGNEQ